MELDGYFYQHFQPGSKQLSGLHLEIRFQHPERLCPYRAACFGNQLSGYRILLDELQITMPGRCICPHIAHFRPYPAGTWKCFTDSDVNQIIQFQQRELPAFISRILRINVQPWHIAFLSYRLYIYSECHIPVQHQGVWPGSIPPAIRL